MLYQTYVRLKDGKWVKWEPAPENYTETLRTVSIARAHCGNKSIYSHACAMPVSWSFA